MRYEKSLGFKHSAHEQCTSWGRARNTTIADKIFFPIDEGIAVM